MLLILWASFCFKIPQDLAVHVLIRCMVTTYVSIRTRAMSGSLEQVAKV